MGPFGLTQNPQPVVDGDDDDVPVAGQDAAVDHVARPLHVGAPVDVDHDRLQTVLIVDVCREHGAVRTPTSGKPNVYGLWSPADSRSSEVR